MDNNAADARARASVEAIFERYMKLAENKPGQLYDYDAMSRVELISVSAARRECVFKFLPTESYANLNNVIHGGAYAVMFDILTTWTIGTIAHAGYWDFLGGVTRSLSISYLRGVHVNTPVYFHCRVIQHGRTMALLRADMTTQDGTICATAEHHKVNVPSLPEHMKVRVPFDEVMEREERERGGGSKL